MDLIDKPTGTSDDLTGRAALFATAAHRAIGHRRKYTGVCYTVHLAEVADIVRDNGGDDAMVAAAWLHDVVEDTQITVQDVEDAFGTEVATLVDWLTDVSKPSDGNRKARKALDLAHSADAPAQAQTIKYADIMSNAVSIADGDANFSKVFNAEAVRLLDAMTKGDPGLRVQAIETLKTTTGTK